MLNIQIVSDLHLEFWTAKTNFNFIKPSAPILALLGDICCCASESDFNVFKRFITEILPLYELILFVPGNHEYYSSNDKASETINQVNDKISAWFKQTSPKLKFLNCASIKIVADQTYQIIGATLWTFIPKDKYAVIQQSMNDYNFIRTDEPTEQTKQLSKLLNKQTTTEPRLISPEDTSNMFMKHCKYIKSQIDRSSKLGHKIILLTHHKPYTTSGNPAYETDLTPLMTNVSLWAYGHTHLADSTKIGNTLVYSNPKGYPYQKTKFNPSFVVQI